MYPCINASGLQVNLYIWAMLWKQTGKSEGHKLVQLKLAEKGTGRARCSISRRRMDRLGDSEECKVCVCIR